MEGEADANILPQIGKANAIMTNIYRLVFTTASGEIKHASGHCLGLSVGFVYVLPDIEHYLDLG